MCLGDHFPVLVMRVLDVHHWLVPFMLSLTHAHTHNRITSAVRSLLKLIPINPQVLEALEVFIHQKPEGASDESYSQPSPEDVLKEFYDVATISPTQLLYNLEVGAQKQEE